MKARYVLCTKDCQTCIMDIESVTFSLQRNNNRTMELFIMIAKCMHCNQQSKIFECQWVLTICNSQWQGDKLHIHMLFTHQTLTNCHRYWAQYFMEQFTQLSVQFNKTKLLKCIHNYVLCLYICTFQHLRFTLSPYLCQC